MPFRPPTLSRRALLALGVQAAAFAVVRRARGGECRVSLDSRERFEAYGISGYDWSKLRDAITPAGEFFVRSHFGVPFPPAPRVAIGGRVTRPGAWTLDELRRLRSRQAVVTVECAGNSIVQGNGLVSTGRWRGCAVGDLLREVGAASPDDVLVFRGADAPSQGAEAYARSMTARDAVAAGALLAWELDGKPLSQEHGAPLRLVVPGWYGMQSVKWLVAIEVRSEPFEGRYQKDWYVNRVKRSDGTVAIEPVTTVAVKSVVATAEARGETIRLCGAAWGGEGGVARVEVTTDGGVAWQPAVLEGKATPGAWRLWRYDWKPAASGIAVVAARAYDARGTAQPLVRPPELAEARYTWNEVAARRLNVAC